MAAFGTGSGMGSGMGGPGMGRAGSRASLFEAIKAAGPTKTDSIARITLLARWKIARMIGNLALDTTLGAIPIAGDVFDMVYKSNQRNLKIVTDHLEKHHPRVIEGTATRVSERPLGAEETR
jgi:hypothetical protein